MSIRNITDHWRCECGRLNSPMRPYCLSCGAESRKTQLLGKKE